MEPFCKNDLDHWRSDYRNFKCYLSVHKSDLGHWRSDLNHFKISAATKVTLATEEDLVITATSKVISASTKVILATEEVVTATLKII